MNPLSSLRPRLAAATRHGFTLIELLTVTAIIGILGMLVFMATGRALLSAKKTKSMANLRTLATAFNLYAVDHQNRYPLQGGNAPGNGATGTDPFYWADVIADYLGGKIATGRVFSGTTTKEVQYPALLDPLVENGSHHSISDYGNNPYAIRYPAKGPLPLGQIAQPARLVLVFPCASKSTGESTWYVNPSYALSTGDGGATNKPSDRVNPGRIACGFADGHVGVLTLAELDAVADKERYFYPAP